MEKTIGFVGLGKMGKLMALRLLEQGVHVVAYNRTKEVTEEFEKTMKSEKKHLNLFHAAYDLKELIRKISAPRTIWLMVPNGTPIDEMLSLLISSGLEKGDTVIDGGNTYYKDSIRRYNALSQKGIRFVDCGTSGGLTGARNGACLMIGGDTAVVGDLQWLWEKIAVKDGWAHFGPPGAGHFVKMVHNGVEYGMNQALGEGFAILEKSPYPLNFAQIAHNWSHGSVVRGWLVELLAQAFDGDPRLANLEGRVGGGETGRWTLEAAREEGVPSPVLEDSLAARTESLEHPTFAGKVVSALRAGYGGHGEGKKR